MLAVSSATGFPGVCSDTNLRLRAQPIPVQFTDITEKAGVTFKHISSPEKKYIVESMSGGVALLDYDNDGYLDIYFVNSLTADHGESQAKNAECSVSQ